MMTTEGRGMPTIEVSANELLKAVQQLSPAELEGFVAQVLALRAERVAPRLSAEETTLLERIQQGMPEDQHRRYRELIDKLRGETITPEERAELLRLTDAAEEWQAKRLEALAELASLRKVSLSAVMDQLGIKPPPYE
jgi:hypothetical protein